MSTKLGATVAVIGVLACSLPALAAPLALPCERFQLKNGLQVVLQRDRSSSKVVVNVLYRVGSANEPPRATGVAHLFEHLMFMGTKRIRRGQIDAIMERAGGWNNAYTTEDTTVYYDVAPPRLLPTLLWIEADRMATLPAALTRKKLDLQRKVVLNERRQSYENAPYGVAYLALPALSFPPGHPYSWPVIGAAAHLRAATVSRLRRLFASFYSPRNASLVIAGSFDPGSARRMAERYFGWIPAAAPPPAPSWRWPLPRASVRRVFRDRVELPKLWIAWRSPAIFGDGDAELDLAANLLAAGKRSLLHQSLVHEQQIAVQVSAYQDSRRLGSQFVIEVTARPKVAPERLERAVKLLLRRFISAPPGRAALARARNRLLTGFVVGLQRLRRRANLINHYLAHDKRPDYLAQDIARYRRASASSVHAAVKAVLRPERRVLLWVLPRAGRAKKGGSR